MKLYKVVGKIAKKKFLEDELIKLWRRKYM
jgi:hypothetical protein